MLDINQENQIIEWIFTHTKTKVTKPICEHLKSGVLLCKLVNGIRANTVKKINAGTAVFAVRENIASFVKGCESIGFNEDLTRFSDNLQAEKEHSVFSVLYSLMKFSERPTSPLTSGGGSSPNSPGLNRAIPGQPVVKRVMAPSPTPGSSGSSSSESSGSSGNLVTKPILSMLSSSSSTPNAPGKMSAKSRIFGTGGSSPGGSSPNTSSPSLSSSSGSTTASPSLLSSPKPDLEELSPSTSNTVISPRKPPAIIRSHTANPVMSGSNGSLSSMSSNSGGSGSDSNIPFISKSSSGPQNTSFTDLNSVSTESTEDYNKKPAPPLPPRFKLPSKENSQNDLFNFEHDNVELNQDSNVQNNNNNNNSNTNENNVSTNRFNLNSNDEESSSTTASRGATFKQPPVSQPVGAGNSSPIYHTVSAGSSTSTPISILPNGSQSIFTPPPSATAQSPPPTSPVLFSTSPPNPSPLVPAVQQQNIKKQRSGTTKHIKNFFSKNKGLKDKSSGNVMAEDEMYQSSSNLSANMDKSMNGGLGSSSVNNSSSGGGLSSSGRNMMNVNYNGNSSNSLLDSASSSHLINSIGSNDGNNSENGSEDGELSGLSEQEVTQELMKSISQVEFLYKDRKVLKDRINFTYPEKYKSFVIYDELLRQDHSPIFMPNNVLAMPPRKQLEFCKMEERRLLSEIFTLKNVLNIVEENKALVIRTEEMQKMIDTLIIEKKSLSARFGEMLGVKAQSEAKKIEEEGIIFSDYKGKLEIKGGNTDKLIERLYNKNIIGSVSEYVDTFLITYRSFTSSKKVMEMLKKTYDDNAYIEVEGESERQFQIEQENLTKKKIRLRICNFLKRWAELFFHDFDTDLIQEYNSFIRDAGDQNISGLLQRTLDKKLNAGTAGTLSTTKSPTFNKNAPASIVPKSPIVSLDDVDPVEIARQLTIVEFELYRSIQSKELLSLSWQKSDKEKRSPNLLKMIYRFNEISNWVTYTIVKETNLKKRAQHLKRFIKLTEELRKLNNFNCVFVVVSALYSASVNRLQKTWGEISKQQMKAFEEVVAITAPNSSFCMYREELHKANPPCIPYLGVHLSDLTFIEEGNPDRLDNGFVNFFKCRMVAEVIKEIQQYQQQPYNLLPVPEISTCLNSHKSVSESECFKLSLSAEPRESVSS